MGDIIETTVTAFQPVLYYKAGDNGFWFDIKAQNKVLVGLAKDTQGRCQYWFEISNPGSIKILKASALRKSKTGLGFTLSVSNYSRFWIAWDYKHLWAGIGNSGEMVIVCPISSTFNFFTFFSSEQNHPCSIKFAVPPLCLRGIRLEPKITAGKLQWKSCDDQLPDEAVIGGYIDGEVVYVVRARHRHSLTPGVFVPSKGLAFIPWGGSDNPTAQFEALCGFDLVWKPATTNRIPVDAFVAGYSEDRHEPLYIGRVSWEFSKIPGKVQLSHKVCYIAHLGKEIAAKNFEVLTEPGLNACCANKYVETMTDFHDARYYNDEDDDGMSDDEAPENHIAVIDFL